jgi:hypothetical protein
MGGGISAMKAEGRGCGYEEDVGSDERVGMG